MPNVFSRHIAQLFFVHFRNSKNVPLLWRIVRTSLKMIWLNEGRMLSGIVGKSLSVNWRSNFRTWPPASASSRVRWGWRVHPWPQSRPQFWCWQSWKMFLFTRIMKITFDRIISLILIRNILVYTTWFIDNVY